MNEEIENQKLLNSPKSLGHMFDLETPYEMALKIDKGERKERVLES